MNLKLTNMNIMNNKELLELAKQFAMASEDKEKAGIAYDIAEGKLAQIKAALFQAMGISEDEDSDPVIIQIAANKLLRIEIAYDTGEWEFTVESFIPSKK